MHTDYKSAYKKLKHTTKQNVYLMFLKFFDVIQIMKFFLPYKCVLSWVQSEFIDKFKPSMRHETGDQWRGHSQCVIFQLFTTRQTSDPDKHWSNSEY